MVELVHNQRQIDALHTSMVTPGFSQTVCAEVASQAYLLADSGDDFPGLVSSYRLQKTVGFAIEKDEMVAICDDCWICSKIFFQDFPDTIINYNLLPFSSLLFFNPKAMSDTLLVV